MVDKNNFISFNKLYKAIKEVAYYDQLNREYNQMTFNSLFYGNFGDYALSHYDYSKSSIVINKRLFYSIFDDNTFYIKNENGKLTINSEKADDYFYSVILNNEDIFNKMINDYEDYREFHTEHLKDAYVVSVDGNSDYCLDLTDIALSFKRKSEDQERDIVEYRRFLRGTKNIEKCIEGNLKMVQYIKENESAYINRWIQIDKRALPKWVNNAIKYYESKHKNIIFKLVDKLPFNKQPVPINVEENNKKVLISKDDLYDRVKISNDLLFKRVDDHFEINEYYINDLKFIDLSNVDFKDVLVSGIDFTDTNINYFDPQKVYKKDLSYCRFGDIDMKDNNIPFSHYTDFNEVNLCGTVIYGDSDFRFNLNGAITDSNTNIIYDHSVQKYNKKK
ncbi:MAG: hypothetical protein Q4E69_01325 [Bacilli bacterium]|nr:hypothetical protein [Bacilli bacterium]